jgi:hypothetical protein
VKGSPSTDIEVLVHRNGDIIHFEDQVQQSHILKISENIYCYFLKFDMADANHKQLLNTYKFMTLSNVAQLGNSVVHSRAKDLFTCVLIAMNHGLF